MSPELEAVDRSPSIAAARTALEEHGRAWVVGGAIRDALLGEPVSDADLAVERGRDLVADHRSSRRAAQVSAIRVSTRPESSAAARPLTRALPT